MSIFCQYLLSNINYFKHITRRSYSNSMSQQEIAKRIVWVDLEMTGLEIEKDHILEIACLVTNADLDIVATGPNLIIHQPDEILNRMNTWCVAQHGESGLTEASRCSSITVQEAENQVLKFVSQHVYENRSPLAGNSVYMDRLFIRKFMPKLDSYLHYRIIDVSTIKELGKRWFQKDYSKMPQKKFQHRCMSDILESVAELKYYRENIFKK
ncbi:oligoribonuclease, mitochondrial isoform X1 [Battus philenor]|uniref:oligoribonuclease, mitochondrial isoform X1 n=2 Tax=Battus philenor TaxID=42288 RepID=UPI0035CFFB5D